MPDWSYRTLFRPLLFRLPPPTARRLALGTLGVLGRSPLGPFVIDFLGHMGPSSALACETLRQRFIAPLGIGSELDPSGFALRGLARFGIGFVVAGPVTLAPCSSAGVTRDDTRQAIVLHGESRLSLELAQSRLSRLPHGVKVIVKTTADEAPHVVEQLVAAGVRVAAVAVTDLSRLSACSVPVLLTVAADERADAVITRLQTSSIACTGVLISGEVQEGTNRLLGAPARAAALALTQQLRAVFTPEECALVVGGGVHEPEQALELFAAGADLVLVDSGLVFSGPGLIKRTNEGLLVANHPCSASPPAPEPAPRTAWYWIWLLGLAMLIGGALALGIAGTRVVLPYDEHFVGMTRAELAALNPRLLDFMTHDRVTLAGTMLALGILYSGLGWHGVRRGYHWAWVAVLSSALVGFFSFFLFLAFGYLEPFHAFVTAILFQLLLLGWHAPLPPLAAPQPAPLREEWRWRLSLWGQLLLVVESLAVIVGGAVIAIVGSTRVFVQEDLDFMQTCSAALAEANPRLLALVAHDRATFGGMLISCGLTTLMASLWGFAAGRSWLFSTLLFAGTIGYACTLTVHYLVGYVDIHHLAPAYAGLLLHWLALALAAPYLLWKPYRAAGEAVA